MIKCRSLLPVLCVLWAIASVLLMCSTARGEATQWAENSHWYEVFYVPEGISWLKAEDAARTRGGYLVCITSTLENDFVYSLISKDERYWFKGQDSDNRSGPWIGAYQTDKRDEPAGHWAWVSGEPWGYTNWSPGEPNNWDGKEDYGCYFGSGTTMSKSWNDSAETPPEGTKITAYIVEFDAKPAATQPPATQPNALPVVASPAPAAEWNWPMLWSWALIGLLLAALAGMVFLWNRARTNALAPSNPALLPPRDH